MPGSEDVFVRQKGSLISWNSVCGGEGGSLNIKDRGQKEGHGRGVEKMKALSGFWAWGWGAPRPGCRAVRCELGRERGQRIYAAFDLEWPQPAVT